MSEEYPECKRLKVDHKGEGDSGNETKASGLEVAAGITFNVDQHEIETNTSGLEVPTDISCTVDQHEIETNTSGSEVAAGITCSLDHQIKTNSSGLEVPADISCNVDQRGNNSHGKVTSVVAQHYNKLEEKGLNERNNSRIIHLRNFNNWIKSMLIKEFSDKCSDRFPSLNVLDMGCGKGGDLLKWKKSEKLTHLICADIAEVSVDQCKSRYETIGERSGSSKPSFTAEFLVADCTKERLKSMFKDQPLKLHIVSCQFAFHYCFESLPQAECMLQNASECLTLGGYFIGTIPDAYDIVSRLKKSDGMSFGNDVYKIEFDEKTVSELPLFGAKYDFYLEGVVNCPEFLVHFPTLLRLAEKYGLKLVLREKFSEFFERKKDIGRSLLGIMKALETYTELEEETLQGGTEEYRHAKEYLKGDSHGHRKKIGTLSQMEWEAVSLYMVFAFQKVRNVPEVQ